MFNFSGSYFAFVSQPPNPVLSKTPLPHTLFTHSSLILLRVQNRPSECLPFSPNHFKAAVLQWFSFHLPYSNTVVYCPRYRVICQPPQPLQHSFFSIFSICPSLLTASCLPSWQCKQPPTIFQSCYLYDNIVVTRCFFSNFAPFPLLTACWHSVLYY